MPAKVRSIPEGASAVSSQIEDVSTEEMEKRFKAMTNPN